MMQTLGQDIRYGVRMFMKDPGFTLIAVVTLALGIGANTAVFSVVNAVLLSPLPYPQAERLIYIWGTRKADPKFEGSLSPHNFTDLRNRNQTFESYFAYNNNISFTLTGDSQPEALTGIMASADFGRVMGVSPVIGRVFTAEEDLPGKNHVALISDGLWKRRFGANPQIIGQQIQLNSEPHTVIGVMPSNFKFPSPIAEVWTPLALDLSKHQRGGAFLESVARLKPGVTIEQAQTDIQNIVGQLEKEFPNSRLDFRMKAEWVREHIFGKIERPILILFGAVVLVLLIACVNVANLLLGRATARWKEIALRSALGASRWSLIRLLLTESVLLAAIGGAAGLLLATYGVDALTAINPAAIPNREKITIDGFVIAFTFFVALLTGVLSGLAPAWQATNPDLNQTLHEDSRSATGAKRLKSLRNALVVAEISLSLVLLVGAGLLIKSFWKLLQVSPGFRPENVVTCLINLPRAKYAEDSQQVDFFRRALEQVRAIPGVQSAGFATSLPFSGSRGTSSFSIDDRPTQQEDRPLADKHQVAPGYFAVMGIPLRAGRDFTDADNISHEGVVIINETAAKHYWPNENPIGKRLTSGMGQEVKLYGHPVSREIIGLVGNVKHEELKDDFQPEIYVPAWQLPALGMTLVVRGQGSAESLIGDIRRAVQAVDREQPIRRVQLLGTAIARSVAPQRFVTTLLLLFAGLALVLAMVGIYGVMSYSVTQRTNEIGIRMALGAQQSDVLKLVIGEGLRMSLIGVAIGLAGAFALTRLISSLLFDVRPTDPMTFASIAMLLVLVVLPACYLPARRATKVDPIIALRYE